MSKKWFIFILVFLTVINLAATGTILYERINRPSPPWDKDKWSDYKRPLKHHLDLTPEQLEAIDRSRKEYWEYAKEPINLIGEMKHRIVTEMTADNPDRTKIDSLIHAVSEIETDLKIFTVNHILKERKHLTPDQRKRLMHIFMDKIEGGRHNPFLHKKFRNKKYRNNDQQSLFQDGHRDRRFESDEYLTNGT
jgi:Spy/CpxP family protein refolding chaperone